MKNHFRRSPVRTPHLRAVAIALMALQGPAYAVDYVWKGAHGNWEDPNQWTLLGVPGADDSVLLAAGSAALSSTRTVGSMRLTGGQVYGGDLTAGALNFEYGTLGGFTTNYATGATTITGSATFNGTRTQDINANHTLTLQGASRWTAGSGAISSTVYGGAIVNNGGFADEGADGPTAYKTLRNGLPNGAGGTFTNNGTYVRTGLGTTRAYGLHNAGTLKVDAGTMELRGNGSSVGQVEVSSGARLSFHESSAVVSGRIANLGVVSFDRSDVTLTDTARLDGAVHVLDGWVYNNNASTISLLSMQGGGHLGGTGHWTVNTLDFQAGTLGGAPNYFPAGATTVTGTATFDGARNQGVSFNHTLTLQGNSRWTAGNGAISGSVFGGAIVNNATFEDAGAGSAAAYKTLRGGGGTFINSGSYVRSGLGVTRAYGFDNRGVLSIASGTVDARDGFGNTGVVNIAAGAVLLTSAANAGRITGTGRVDTGGGNVALASSGTLDPGDGATLGTLTIEGGLRLTDGSVLRIDLGSAGLSDHLVVTNQASWDGELSVWLGQGAALQLGDVYTIASYGQRLAGSTFDSVSWHGVGAAQFSVEYGTDQLLLRVTAVPEPATYALWALAGVAGLQLYRRNRTIS